jgi:hypothetical protein
MKPIYLLLFIILFSCSPGKIKDYEKDYTQQLVGKIKSITINKYEYKFLKKDTFFLAKTTIQKFDIYTNLINETIKTEIDQNDYYYKYENDLLIEKKIISENSISFTTYKYDTKHNQIEEKSFDDKRVFSVKTQKFDSYNNPIETKISFFGKEKVSTKIEYNYKKQFLTSKTVVDTFSKTLDKIKYFNKKGYIVKEPLNNFATQNYNTYYIDKKGNLTKKTFHKSDKSIIETVTYKNTYDKMGNIITRDRFLNGKLIEKNNYEITYY